MDIWTLAMIPIILSMLSVVVLTFAFWLWMLIDCLKRKFDDKLTWVIVLIFLNLIGAILYYFIVKSQDKKRKRPRR